MLPDNNFFVNFDKFKEGLLINNFFKKKFVFKILKIFLIFNLFFLLGFFPEFTEIRIFFIFYRFYFRKNVESKNNMNDYEVNEESYRDRNRYPNLVPHHHKHTIGFLHQFNYIKLIKHLLFLKYSK